MGAEGMCNMQASDMIFLIRPVFEMDYFLVINVAGTKHSPNKPSHINFQRSYISQLKKGSSK
jgi:hypothetical protein